MSYLGLVRPLVNMKFEGRVRDSAIAVLEIGIEKGYSSFGIVQGLIERSSAFAYVGVDIKLDNEVSNTFAAFSGINYFEQRPGRPPAIFRENDACEKSVFMYEENSLDFLERNKGKYKFDIIIVDGDHNYYTVLKELNLLLDYITENTIIICDDYFGKYAEEDLYYADRPTYNDVKIATRINKQERTKKKGVQTAIDDFVMQPGCPLEIEKFESTSWCVLKNKNRSLKLFTTNGLSRDDILVFSTKDAKKKRDENKGLFSTSPFI